MIYQLSHIQPVRVVGITNAATTSGLPTSISSPAAVKDVVIVNEDYVPITIASGSRFYAYQSQEYALTYQTPYSVVYDNVPFEDEAFTLVTESGVQFNVAGTYEVTYCVTMSGLTGAGVTVRDRVECTMQENTGSGFADIGGTAGIMYSRQQDFGSSASITFLRDFAVNDVIKLVVTHALSDGPDTVVLADNGSSLLIRAA